MTLKAAAIAVVVLAVLAGCFGGDGDGTTPTTSTTTTTSRSTTTSSSPPIPPATVVDLLVHFNLDGCRGVTALALQRLEEIQPLLPPDFVAAPFSLTGTDGDSAFGALAIDLFFCSSLTTPNARVDNTVYGQVYTFVEKPEIQGAIDGTQEYVFRMLAGGDVLALLWPAAGYDTYNATATIEVTPLDPLPARVARATLGNYTFAGQGQDNPASPLSITGPFARYTRHADRSTLVWTGNYSFPVTFPGAGVFGVPPDDPFAPRTIPGTGNLAGPFVIYDTGAMLDSTLRRVFPT